MPSIKKNRIADRIFLVEFASQYKLAATMLRFQEYYESKKFRSKVFSLEDFMDWYAKVYGNFTYYQDWSGFNIPSEALRPFYDGKFDPLLKKERQLLDLFQGQDDDFYIVAVSRSQGRIDQATLKHEIAHALFYTQPEYRKKVLAALKKYDTKRMEKELFSSGYCRQVLKDEVHAHVLTDLKAMPKTVQEQLAPLRNQLRRLYREYSTVAGVHAGG